MEGLHSERMGVTSWGPMPWFATASLGCRNADERDRTGLV